jgi:Zn-finger nucleic acid-binding protein
MLCPECRNALIIVECDRVEVDACWKGHGLWFDADELRQLFEVAGVPDSLHDLEQRLGELPEGGTGRKRKCPRCHAKMRHVKAPGGSGDVILDRCPHGHGLWFDDGELAEVLSADLAEGTAAFDTLRQYLGGFVKPKRKRDEET